MNRQHIYAAVEWIQNPPTDEPGLLLGEDFILRYAQPESPAARRLKREAEVLPKLAQLDLRTPTLLEFYEGGEVSPLTTSLQVPLHASSGIWRYGTAEEPDEVWQQVGAYLQKLHRADAIFPSPQRQMPEPGPALFMLREEGILSSKTAALLGNILKMLKTESPAERIVNLHGRLTPDRLILGEDDQLLGIWDWSHAGLGAAPLDFLHLPASATEGILRTYHSPDFLLHLEQAHLQQLLLNLQQAAAGDHHALDRITSRSLEWWLKSIQRISTQN